MGLSRLVAVPDALPAASAPDPGSARLPVDPSRRGRLADLPAAERADYHGRIHRVGEHTAGTGLQVTFADGGQRTVDHLLLGTGYRVDIARYPFLAPSLLARVRRVNGYPMLGRGMESSVPGLHFVGAPAAWSFGPIMRFVSGGWYTGRALAQVVAGRPAAGRLGAEPAEMAATSDVQ